MNADSFLATLSACIILRDEPTRTKRLPLDDDRTLGRVDEQLGAVLKEAGAEQVRAWIDASVDALCASWPGSYGAAPVPDQRLPPTVDRYALSSVLNHAFDLWHTALRLPRREEKRVAISVVNPGRETAARTSSASVGCAQATRSSTSAWTLPLPRSPADVPPVEICALWECPAR